MATADDEDIEAQVLRYNIISAIEFHVKRLKQAAVRGSAGLFTNTESTENMVEHVLNINRTGNPTQRSRRVSHTFGE